MDIAGMFSLQGRVALVTGASGVLGAHFARVLHGAGASVALAARREAATAALGAPCDILVNNAGIAVTKPALQQSAEDWDAVLDVNLRGCFLVAQEAAKRLVAAKRPGVVVNIASVLGERIIPGVVGYTAAKAGLLHMTRHLAVEWARHGIRVNAIAPGYIATDINRDYFASDSGQAMIKRIPQRRLGAAEDLTGPLLLLASDAGAHMTGAVVTVDGGHSINPL